MADNVTLPGTGSVVATDDVSGVQFQVVKLDVGGNGATVPVTGTTGLPIVTTPVTYTSRGGTITTGATAQQLAASNSARRGFFIQNNSSGDLWFSAITTAVASQPSFRIPAGALYESPVGGCPTAAISIIGATTGQAFSAAEF